MPEETLQVAQINAVCTRIETDWEFAFHILSNRKAALESFPLNAITLNALMAIEAGTKDDFIRAAANLIPGSN